MPSALIIRKKAAAKKNSYKCLWRTFRKSAVKNKIRKEEQKTAKTHALVDALVSLGPRDKDTRTYPHCASSH